MGSIFNPFKPFTPSVQHLRPTRTMSAIYTEVAAQATVLAERLELTAKTAKDVKDKNTTRDAAVYCRRFASRSTKAAETVARLFDDGSLKEYCRRFDNYLKQFITFAEVTEKELLEIDKRQL
jgi:hypothetical protein